MNTMIDQMIKVHQVETLYDQKNAMKEVIQEISLCGLSRAGFFNRAAFYGGTALRVFYELDRFSEDLDFSLMTNDEKFDITKYFPMLEKEVKAYGLNLEISEKQKTQDSNIRSAFLKGNTKEHLLLFYPQDGENLGVAGNESVKIKFEVDINPPKYATFERKYRLLPAPYEVNMYDMPSLFVGKIHAVIGRSWKNRIKGRDLYDYVFYLSRGAKLNLEHLRERLIQSGHLTAETDITIEDVKEMLCERFKKIDYNLAKEDVEPFIKDSKNLSIWSTDFFEQITQGLQARK